MGEYGEPVGHSIFTLDDDWCQLLLVTTCQTLNCSSRKTPPVSLAICVASPSVHPTKQRCNHPIGPIPSIASPNRLPARTPSSAIMLQIRSRSIHFASKVPSAVGCCPAVTSTVQTNYLIQNELASEAGHSWFHVSSSSCISGKAFDRLLETELWRTTSVQLSLQWHWDTASMRVE